MANEYFARYADTVGDGSGFIIANGDYSDVGDGVTDFTLAALDDQEFAINRLIIFIEDTYVGQFDPLGYGGIAALTNGVEILIVDDQGVTIKDLTDGVPVISNAGWARLCFDVNQFNGNGNVAIAVRWTFDRGVPQGYGGHNHHTPLVLHASQKFVVRLNDDLSELLDHTFMVQGVVMNSPANLAD